MEKSMNDKNLAQDDLRPAEDGTSKVSKTVEPDSAEVATTGTGGRKSKKKTAGSPGSGADPQAVVDAVIESSSDSAGDESGPSPRADAVATPPPPQPEPERKKRSWIGVLAFLLAICALIVAGYGFQKIQELQAENVGLKSTTQGLSQSLEQNLQKSITAASSAGDQARAAQDQIKSLQSELTKQQQNVDELQDRLTRSMKQISQVGTDKRKDWLLAEVEYLLRLANQRVLMEKSPAGALALLQSSDTILKETDDVSIYNVRKAIASDIAALQAVPSLDMDGIFLKLAALNEQVDQLRLIPISDKRELPQMLQKVTADGVSETWNQGLKTSWNKAMDKLEKLVVIQHRDEPIEPLLSPEQVYFLQQNLHLMLEQAQLSLLQGHQGSYDASLNKASDWVGKYFEADDPTTVALLKGLEELKSVQVSPDLPDISSSLKALKSYLAEVHSGKGAA